MNEVTEISKEFYNEDQSWHYDLTVALVDHPDTKLRVFIERNAYDFQSRMVGYVLDPVRFKWNRLIAKPITGAHCQPVSYVDKHPDRTLFDIDARGIIDQLLLIIL
jgi:hypothetical protein